MTDSKGYRFVSEEPVPPGETIAEILDVRGISQTDFALLLGRSTKNVNQLVSGVAPITHELAIDLERVLDVPAAFWNSAEARYRDLLARRQQKDKLAADAVWAKGFPLKEMADRDWIARESGPAERTEETLCYFGVSSPEAWQDYWGSPRRLAARMTAAYTADIPALTAWLRRGEIEAQDVETEPYDAARFREALVRLRGATVERPAVWQPLLTTECAAAGVAVVFVPELPKIRCHAVSRWLTPDKALIQLCLRYRTDDQMWFSFFHEAAHILKHGKKRLFLDDLAADSPDETEADRFAADSLIPPAEFAVFVAQGKPTRPSVQGFARRIGIAPGIVVGRLQHDGVIEQSWMNDLKVRLEWARE
jgi:HTH-type transcriptional regulator/antitoxin HigA